MFHSSYYQIFRGEFLELIYSSARVDVDNPIYKNIPNELKNKTVGQVILTFFEPPVGALIAAMVSTFGIYIIGSVLYVSQPQLYPYVTTH